MTGKSKSAARRLSMALAAVAVMSLVAGDAFARAGRGGSIGSRGTFSKQAPPTTNTAPRQADPLPGAQTGSPAMRQNPAAGAATQAAQPSRMGGLMRGLGFGLLGAGLFGLLSGNGFFSGLGSLMGILGFLLQMALIFFVVRWAFNYFRNRQQVATASGPAVNKADLMARSATGNDAAAAAPASQGSTPMASGPAPLDLQERDFNAFERLLGEIQDAFSRGDRTALQLRATPDIAHEFDLELRDFDRRGVVNKLADVKLLQGDLAQAWRETGAEYATVAMRYAIRDWLIDKASGRIVDGNADRPEEVTELWTFVRRPGETSEGWKLSAIQQA